MRPHSLVFFFTTASALTACSDPDCASTERRVGDLCMRIRYAADGAASTAEEQADSAASTPGQDAGGMDSSLAGDAESNDVLPDGSTRAVDASASENDSAPPVMAPVDPCPGSTVNDCGGCGPLEHAVGEPCSNGGTGPCALPGSYQCLGEKLVCNAPPPAPSAEVCDGVDNDCNGQVDDGAKNACGGCGPVPAEVCDGVDNDCDGMTDEGFTRNACGGCGVLAHAKDAACSEGTGGCAVSGTYVCTSVDAVACNAVAKPASAEVCDAIDNDCDGAVDEDVADPPTWYKDCDGDGYGILEGSVKSCTMPVTSGCKAYVTLQPVFPTTLDCRDDSTAYTPGRTYGTSFAVPGEGPWANELKYDVNCDGIVKVADALLVSGRYLPWCSGCSAAVPECAAGPKPDTTYCGAKSSTSRILKWDAGGKYCYGENADASLLCL